MAYLGSLVTETKYLNIPVISPGLYNFVCFLGRERKIYRRGSVIMVNVVWLHENNCSEGVVACLYQEGGINVLSPNSGGPITGWAYEREGL